MSTFFDELILLMMFSRINRRLSNNNVDEALGDGNDIDWHGNHTHKILKLPEKDERKAKHQTGCVKVTFRQTRQDLCRGSF